MTPEQFDQILSEVSTGVPVRVSIKNADVVVGNFYALLARDESAAERYARAKFVGCTAVADETVELQDEPPRMMSTEHGERVDAAWVQWQKNRVELRRWHLSKLVPKVYGERQTIEHEVGDNFADQLVKARERSKAKED